MIDFTVVNSKKLAKLKDFDIDDLIELSKQTENTFLQKRLTKLKTKIQKL